MKDKRNPGTAEYEAEPLPEAEVTFYDDLSAGRVGIVIKWDSGGIRSGFKFQCGLRAPSEPEPEKETAPIDAFGDGWARGRRAMWEEAAAILDRVIADNPARAMESDRIRAAAFGLARTLVGTLEPGTPEEKEGGRDPAEDRMSHTELAHILGALHRKGLLGELIRASKDAMGSRSPTDIGAPEACSLPKAPIERLRALATDPKLTPEERRDLVRAIQGLQYTRARTGHHGSVADIFAPDRLRARVDRLRAVARAVLIDHDQSILPEEDAEGVKRWWKLPATKSALDALQPGDLEDLDPRESSEPVTATTIK